MDGFLNWLRLRKRLLAPVAGGAVGYLVSYLSTCVGNT